MTPGTVPRHQAQQPGRKRSRMTFSNRTTDDLIRFATPQTPKQSRLLFDFGQLTHGHPELFEQLAELVYSRLETNNSCCLCA